MQIAIKPQWMQLRKQNSLPDIKDNKPVKAEVTIPVMFKLSKIYFLEVTDHSVTLLYNPVATFNQTILTLHYNYLSFQGISNEKQFCSCSIG